jgi:uncharacterized protein
VTTKNSPYAVAVYDLMRHPGSQREQRLSIPVTERLGEGLISVPEGATLDVDLRLESMHEGILATAQVDGSAKGQCGRCLIAIEQPVQVDFQELFAYPSEEAFDYEVHDDHVDLEPLIRDAVVLSLPFQPVCRPDCPGLDPETGERLADVPDREPTQTIDPRWSALQDFGGPAAFQASDTDEPTGNANPENTEKR